MALRRVKTLSASTRLGFQFAWSPLSTRKAEHMGLLQAHQSLQHEAGRLRTEVVSLHSTQRDPSHSSSTTVSDSRLQEERVALENRNMELAVQVQRHREEFAKLETDKAAISEQHDLLVMEIDQLRSGHISLDMERGNLVMQVQDMQQEIDSFRVESRSMEMGRRSIEMENEELRRQAGQHAAERGTISAELARIRAEHDVMAMENRSLLAQPYTASSSSTSRPAVDSPGQQAFAAADYVFNAWAPASAFKFREVLRGEVVKSIKEGRRKPFPQAPQGCPLNLKDSFINMQMSLFLFRVSCLRFCSISLECCCAVAFISI